MRVISNISIYYFILLLLGCAARQDMLLSSNSVLGLNDKIQKSYNINTNWWTDFHDLQLNKIIDIALKKNAEFATSAINIKKALYQAKLLGAELLPELSSSGSLETSSDLNQDRNSNSIFKGVATINYELDIWRKLYAARTAGEAEYEATIEDYYALRLTLVNNVIDVYFRLSYIYSAINIIKNKINIYEKLVKNTQAKFLLGKIPSLDLQKSRQSLFAARQQLISLQFEQQIARQSLIQALNIKPTELSWLNYPNILSCKTLNIDLNIPLAVLANRPDVKAAEYRLKKSFFNITSAEKELYPSISISYGISSSSSELKTALNFPLELATIQIKLPFLNWNKIKWNIKISEADYDIAKIDFESKIKISLNEINTAYFSYNNSLESYQTALDKYTTDIKIVNYYKTRYENGADDITDWLDAEAVAIDSDLTTLRTYYEIIKSEITIFKALAGRYTLKN